MKKNKGTFIGCWLIAIVLAGFYCTMLVLGANPQVGIEYRMYYITHELSDWPGYGQLSYEWGTVEYCTELKDRQGQEQTWKVCQRKGQGFLPDQYEGSESTGDASYLYYIPEESTATATFTVSINGFQGDGEVAVYAEETLLGTFAGEGDYAFPMENLEEDQLLTLKFVTNNCNFRLWSTCITA